MHALAGEDDTLSSVLSALPPMAGSVRLLDILEGTPIPTFVIDCNHRVTHWNRACEAIIGISAAETAVAIAIIINIYRNLRNIGVKSLREMKW